MDIKYSDVLFDGTHLVCDDLETLHRVAQSVRLKREWFQDHPIHPHYDVFSKSIRIRLKRLGVTCIDEKQLVRRMGYIPTRRKP